MEILTDNVRINGLLKRLFELRALLTIKISDQQHEYTTAVIKVSPEKGFFYLDELKPEQGHERLIKNPLFKAKAQIGGIYIAFEANIDAFGEQNNIHFYRIKIPSKLDYYQRRASVRITLSAANPLPVKLKSADGDELEGAIADLSLGGLRVRFTSDIPNKIQPGQKFICTFPLPPNNKESFSSEVVIRAIRHKGGANQALPFVGAQFTSVSKINERQIQKTVMTLQRAAQQKRNN